MATRNAASVLPDPVGAAIRVSAPPAMWGQPWACASVGPSGKRRRNHSATAGWKPSTPPPARIGGASSGAVSWVTSLIVSPGYDSYPDTVLAAFFQAALSPNRGPGPRFRANAGKRGG